MPAVLERLGGLMARPANRYHEAHRHAKAHKFLAVVALIALILQTSWLFISLFEPPLPYRIANAGNEPLDSQEFLDVLSTTTAGWISRQNAVQVLTNGDRFYPAELEAIAGARRFIHIECYIFQQDRVTDRILHALEERARAGVEVRMAIDAVGSAAYPDARFAALRQAGGRVAWYHCVGFFSWPRANNRTHRELTVVDGAVAFAGGAGYADQWLYGDRHDPKWRDTVFRFEGDAAAGLDGTFSENWLEASGELLVAPKYYPPARGCGSVTALVVRSSPTSGRSTEARVLLQTLIAKASRSVEITVPYFLPDKTLLQELVKAVRRGVNVRILVPGSKNDHLMTRRSSRALYGDLLRAGARIFEYQPSMIHAKTMVIDGLWVVGGSTNFDSRSFALNDEVNIAMPDAPTAARLDSDFENDLKSSREVSYQQWKHRPIWDRALERIGWLIQKEE